MAVIPQQLQLMQITYHNYMIFLDFLDSVPTSLS